MIIGTVNANREASIRLQVRGPDGHEQEMEALIDTGFNGFLTLPLAVITSLGLPRLGRGRAILADGSEVLFNVYEATVRWEGQSRTVELDATETATLVGMALLEGYTLRIEVVSGGRVTIEAVS